ncbi:bifunctional diaminohydroxyphosphoribosylaminopyrimidine deaminase/5-amino-6-(5-phosphoribosylamino)uracil reductase RibD [Chlorobium sp. N1]|uniref:bifunctional diaminohydroxyphosphoribosylaminopyrimidine deaminase/5-amino-6-(5-phosphoribosylamino)uracil reductase RibD n=1 Tax=Chlorobium sp. N1 TaxID=2491138 RepID=UPI001F60B087|nr:bifunctional diaminohydroxyphosphoribosylaminopyrimidine deaminase/5-amino-6-(5-phosphoribosylamino)uracil reductase RibD [Chlorobium sp. N1]
MARCIELARLGSGSVSPNPMVGSLLVCEGEVVGEGYHERCGGPHAEVNAIAAVGDPELLRRSTLYVNLEPCSHFGRTPPCSDLIIEKGIPRVVVGCRDPNPKVAGRGIDRLRSAGVTVREGVLEAECLRLNEAFITSHRKGRPFIALKLAETLDGRIATRTGASKWITGSEARREVHRLRSGCDAVLSSSATVLADGARLTVRDAAGGSPLRVVLDSSLSVPFDAPVFSPDAPTLVFAARRMQGTSQALAAGERGIEVVFVGEAEGGLDLCGVLAELHRREVLSVLVEAGGRLASSFVRSGLADKLFMFIAPKLFGADGAPSFGALGVEAPDGAAGLRFEPPRVFGEDILLEAYFQQPHP